MPGKKEQFERLKQTAAKLDTSPVDYFLSAGLDYKGQTQSGYTMNGGGLSANISFNPGAVVGMQAQVGIEGSVTRAKETLVVLQRGPSEIQGARGPIEIDTPVILNCLAGVQWEGKIGVSASLGFNWSASTSDRSSGTYTYTGQDQSSNSDCEIAAIGLELNAGATANVSYTYSNLYAFDPAPMWFEPVAESRKEVGETLEAILETGSTKAKLKKEVVDFINGHTALFGGNISYTTWTGGHTSTDKLVGRLSDGILAISQKQRRTRADRKIRDEARNLRGMLQVWSGAVPPNSMCFLRLTSHKPGVGGAIEASAEVKGSVAVVASGSVKVTATLASVACSWKFAAMRYQTQISPDDPVICTQDTTIRYSQYRFDALRAAIKAEGTVLGQQLVDVDEGVSAWDKTINRMSYRSVITYWHAPEPRPAPTSSTSAEPPPETLSTGILWGSGLAFGESCVIENLHKLATEGYDPVMAEFSKKSAEEYATLLSTALNVPVVMLMAFLQSPDVISIIRSLYSQGAEHTLEHRAIPQPPPKRGVPHPPTTAPPVRQSEQTKFDKQYETGGGKNVELWRKRALLIEASFVMNANTVTVPVKVVKKKRTIGSFGSRKTVYDSFVMLEGGDEVAKIYKASPNFRSGKKPQCLRLRYRIQDSKSDDRTLFTLGIKLSGNGGGIALQSVERAGSEGIVDLATTWYRGDGSVETGDSAAKYNGTGMPAVALFCQ